VTHAIVLPPVFEELGHSPRVAERDVASLRPLATGGAHLAPGSEQRASERLACVARGGYGMTGAFIVSGPNDRPPDRGSVGWLAAGTEARIVDPAGGRDLGVGYAGA
jgi:acyl-CoA synthetase (AMP-forming)/AMP-acid ligase II